jgi:hypothetical protein
MLTHLGGLGCQTQLFIDKKRQRVWGDIAAHNALVEAYTMTPSSAAWARYVRCCMVFHHVCAITSGLVPFCDACTAGLSIDCIIRFNVMEQDIRVFPSDVRVAS